MATDTQTAPPPITFHTRVLSIPLVSSSLETIHSTLSTSPYTKRAYETSSSIAHSAFDTATRVTAPVYPRVLPVITAADGYANKGLDTLQTRFPYPFESTPEKVYSDLRKAPEDARSVAYKTLDERIKTPAYGLAKGVDSRLAPLVDILESVLTKLHAAPEHSASPSSSTSDASTSTTEKAQVTRAKELVFGARDHIVVLTTEQAKALRDQNVYIQRAAEKAEAINATLTSQYHNVSAGISAYKGKGVELGKEAQAKVYDLSHALVAELEKIQSTTASLPAQIQTTFKPLTDKIGSALTDMKAVLTSQEEGVGVSEKASRVGAIIKERVGPIVEEGRTICVSAIDKFVAKKDEAAAAATDTSTANGLPNGTS
ncbi:hypothetical protein CPB86DRAFT_795099 [Serendipita vermifera]|nr:hypothetical protein CPB86DRAFT_795099 [Serendipita vermifera]